MLTIKLGDIHGIHPDFSRVECELDLAPIGLPDPALIYDLTGASADAGLCMCWSGV